MSNKQKKANKTRSEIKYIPFSQVYFLIDDIIDRLVAGQINSAEAKTLLKKIVVITYL